MHRHAEAALADGELLSTSRLEPRPGVWSEVGTLRTVLMHRPGSELRSVAADPERALFSGRVSEHEAAAEHDAFTATLRANGVETLLLDDLLHEVIPDPHRVGLLSHWLPNLMYPRDPSAWIGGGFVLGAMAAPIRRRESGLFARVYADHPRFRDAARWTNGGAQWPAFEGEDVLLAGAGRVIIGSSPRTTMRGATDLARALIGAGAVTEVAIVDVPAWAGFHLDLVMTMVDRHKVAIRRGLREHLRATLWRAHGEGIRPEQLTDPLQAFPEPVELVELDEPRRPGEPLSWDHGTNLLALSPGRVISYAHNERSNECLSAAGVDVIPIGGAALARGRGGPRCLTCPVARDP